MRKETRRILKSFWQTSLAAGLLLFGISCYEVQQEPTTANTKTTPTNTSPRIVSYETKPSNTIEPAQTNSSGGTVKTLKLASGLMGREMPYRVVVPNDYETKTADRYTVVYLLHGLTGHYNEWTDLGNITQLAATHNFILVTPEGNDGWYTDNPTIRNDMYESYIVRELIPEIDKSFRTFPDRDHRIIAGLSMGGYGAVKFGLKFPEMFSLVGSFSGAFVTGKWSEKVGGNKLIGKSLDTVFGPLNSEARKTNDVFNFVGGLSTDRLKNLPYIYLSCGTEDVFIKTNRELAAMMNEKKIPNEFHTPPGRHDWDFWGSQIRDFLDMVDRRIKK
ncbi:alpha/beta hydrolase family protein [soil metagenome]